MNIRLGAFSHSVCQSRRSSLYAARGEKDSNDQHKSWHSCVYCSIRLASIIDLESLAEWSKTQWIFIHLIFSPSLGNCGKSDIDHCLLLYLHSPKRATIGFALEHRTQFSPFSNFLPTIWQSVTMLFYFIVVVCCPKKCMKQKYHFSKNSWMY